MSIAFAGTVYGLVGLMFYRRVRPNSSGTPTAFMLACVWPLLMVLLFAVFVTIVFEEFTSGPPSRRV